MRPEPGTGMHVLRHTATSAWLSAGVNVAAVAAWLGDTAQVALATYAHMMPDDDRAGRRARRRVLHRVCTRCATRSRAMMLPPRSAR
jgi:integrase